LTVPAKICFVSYTKRNYTDIESVADAMHFLWNSLACEQLGVTLVE